MYYKQCTLSYYLIKHWYPFSPHYLSKAQENNHPRHPTVKSTINPAERQFSYTQSCKGRWKDSGRLGMGRPRPTHGTVWHELTRLLAWVLNLNRHTQPPWHFKPGEHCQGMQVNRMNRQAVCPSSLSSPPRTNRRKSCRMTADLSWCCAIYNVYLQKVMNLKDCLMHNI